ncbi:23S rRNA (pseudouridine(1915)-N(3))-methyltransferase RlmH [Paludibacter sp. 221]|uniref:23S rRNA (pseudouridine(1915)-N(3))-methyltransferase RlmH n=1 Tax=Paludibacter sp. 221 TaxID=2302939 RepID=UPI0013D20C5A|nr:23S rRNA (pseudouridine(1915)-N(3))-methyltransferase RlmH [Paludibacter sp. 221]NDV47133.1 23S rRNA (pseudouridine(1915)-N(3))-methyltransferase RlmH [Paludibacter sp. 221]
MKINFLVLGKTTDKYLLKLIDEYQGRLAHYVSFSMQVIPELKNTKHLSVAEQKEKEGELILKQIENGDELILLDEKGKEFTSVAFSEQVERKMLSSVKRIVFVVGGPYGFSDGVYKRANQLISLSKMTFSHQMVRLIFVEQLYRAMTILKGEPYHHE